MTAKESGDEWIINGSKCFISAGGISGLYIVMLLTGADERSCIAVPLDSKGLSFGPPEKKMGWRNSKTAMVNFEDVRVPKSYLIGERG
jgi:alkylation response protein AidB-like acyl-CoA dehydrogenase